MAIVTEYMESKAFINYAGQDGGGFSEVFHQNTTVYATANANFTLLLSSRASLLAGQCSIVHATSSRKTVKNDSALPVNYDYLPMYLFGEAVEADRTCNDREVGLLFELDNGAGKMVSRLLRMVRDSWVDNNTCLVAIADEGPAFAIPVVATAPLDAPALAVSNFLQTLGYVTSCIVKANGPPVTQWNVTPWQTIRYKRIGYRDMGRGFSNRKGRRKAKV